jgi:hypothetical protein
MIFCGNLYLKEKYVVSSTMKRFYFFHSGLLQFYFFYFFGKNPDSYRDAMTFMF